jgi:hypothetical protein
MKGLAVKRFVTASSISRSMLTSAYCARERGRIPEDADAADDGALIERYKMKFNRGIPRRAGSTSAATAR